MKGLVIIGMVLALEMGIGIPGVYGWTEVQEGLAVWHPDEEEKLYGYHAEYPFGSWVLVRNPENNREVRVTIVNRIEKETHVLIDLSEAAAAALGIRTDRAEPVRLELLRRLKGGKAERMVSLPEEEQKQTGPNKNRVLLQGGKLILH
jgi:rare lipoprotein A (peptidoglycan hydrolase)